MENAHEGHRERLRQRILKEGLDALHSHEIIEYLLYPMMPRRDTNPIAHALLDRFGSMQALFDAAPADIAAVDGMSILSAQWLKSIGRAVRSYIEAPEDFIPMHNHREARLFAQRAFSTERTSGSWLFCLNSFGNVIHSLQLDGTCEWHSAENMHLILSQALACQANSILLMQQRRDTRLLQSDLHHTETLMNSLAKVQISLVEHLIVDIHGNIAQRLLNPWVGNAGLAETSSLLAHWLDEE